jgi:hypothetical protein
LCLIARHRNNVIRLALNVEIYCELVNILLAEKIVNDGNDNQNEYQLQKLKGKNRSRILWKNSETLMAAKEALQL